jgi:RimJ/RimL family protein N-acetyltransferase
VLTDLVGPGDSGSLTPDAPRLETARLVLRGWRASDLAPFAALNGDPQVMEFFPAPITAADSDAMVGRIGTSFARDGFGLWAVERIDAGAFIGFVGLTVPSYDAPFMPTVEVGWRLAKEHWGQGFATEAARRSLAFGFNTCGLSEIVSFTAVVNTRSIAVMQRLGMSRDPAEDFDHPRVPSGHLLQRHVLYRMPAQRWTAIAP